MFGEDLGYPWERRKCWQLDSRSNKDPKPSLNQFFAFDFFGCFAPMSWGKLYTNRNYVIPSPLTGPSHRLLDQIRKNMCSTLVGSWALPLWKMTSSVWIMKFSKYGKIIQKPPTSTLFWNVHQWFTEQQPALFLTTGVSDRLGQFFLHPGKDGVDVSPAIQNGLRYEGFSHRRSLPSGKQT